MKSGRYAICCAVRSQLVRQRTAQILSIQNLLSRNTGACASANQIKRWDDGQIDALVLLPAQQLAIRANVKVMKCVDEQIDTLEKAILVQAKLREDYRALCTVSGVGKVLGLTIALEAGEITRFAGAGSSEPADLIAHCHRPARASEVAPASRATQGWIVKDEATDLCEPQWARRYWTRWGTEGFLGLPRQPGASAASSRPP